MPKFTHSTCLKVVGPITGGASSMVGAVVPGGLVAAVLPQPVQQAQVHDDHVDDNAGQ